MTPIREDDRYRYVFHRSCQSTVLHTETACVVEARASPDTESDCGRVQLPYYKVNQLIGHTAVHNDGKIQIQTGAALITAGQPFG